MEATATPTTIDSLKANAPRFAAIKSNMPVNVDSHDSALNTAIKNTFRTEPTERADTMAPTQEIDSPAKLDITKPSLRQSTLASLKNIQS